MKIDKWQALRSLRNEAERQSEFYSRRGDEAMRDTWADIGDCASEAMEIRGELILTVLHKPTAQVGPQPAEVVHNDTKKRAVLKDPPIIMCGEQGQQLHKAFNRKAI